MTNRDERAILVTALQRAGLEAPIDESGAFASASLSVSFPDVPSARFVLDATTTGWLRVATTMPIEELDIGSRLALGLVYAQTGLGHVHHDERNRLLRIAASLQAVDDAPSGSAVLAVVDHLARVRHKIASGEGDVRAVIDPSPLPEEPTLRDAAGALEKTLSLVAEKDGSFVGGLHEPRSDTKCALRIHTAAPGIFALDAWSLPAARTPVDPAHVERVHLFDATLHAGAMILFQDGLLLYRWACPYRWLDVAQLESAAPAQVALDAFMRWRRG